MMPWAGNSSTPSLGKGVNSECAPSATVRPGARRAATGTSIELYPGQIVLLMGPSGSGKSTLLGAILSGLTGCRRIPGR